VYYLVHKVKARHILLKRAAVARNRTHAAVAAALMVCAAPTPQIKAWQIMSNRLHMQLPQPEQRIICAVTAAAAAAEAAAEAALLYVVSEGEKDALPQRPC
jgi:REP element-mobilizing transposase RayT